MHMDEQSMNLSRYEDLRIDTKSTSEIITECFAEPFIPDDEEGKYSSHGIILDHFLSKCFDDHADPDLDLELDNLMILTLPHTFRKMIKEITHKT